MFSHDNVTLTLYKTAMKKLVHDFVIRFDGEEKDLHQVIEKSYIVFNMLYDKYKSEGKVIWGRLVARVNYLRLNDADDDDDACKMVTYFHPSYAAEVIDTASDFFYTHMLKIGERMESFNRNGSKLIIKNIEEIHIHISEGLHAKGKYPVYDNHETYDSHHIGH